MTELMKLRCKICGAEAREVAGKLLDQEGRRWHLHKCKAPEAMGARARSKRGRFMSYGEASRFLGAGQKRDSERGSNSCGHAKQELSVDQIAGKILLRQETSRKLKKLRKFVRNTSESHDLRKAMRQNAGEERALRRMLRRAIANKRKKETR